jgi:hypothetical protein
MEIAVTGGKSGGGTLFAAGGERGAGDGSLSHAQRVVYEGKGTVRFGNVATLPVHGF